MTEGIVRIYTAVVEPENKEVLWLRPFLDKEGYELLYYGPKGWTPLCCSDSAQLERPRPEGPENTPEDNEEEKDCPCDYL